MLRLGFLCTTLLCIKKQGLYNVEVLLPKAMAAVKSTITLNSLVVSPYHNKILFRFVLLHVCYLGVVI